MDAATAREELHLVVDNPRFLILPWIAIPNLGSHLLAIVRRRLPEDWTERCNTKPVLIETFVEHRDTPAPSTGLPAGSMSEPLGDAGAMIGNGSSTSLERTSGSDRSEKTGNESSTGDTLHAVTGRPNAYLPDTNCAGRAPARWGPGRGRSQRHRPQGTFARVRAHGRYSIRRDYASVSSLRGEPGLSKSPVCSARGSERAGIQRSGSTRRRVRATPRHAADGRMMSGECCGGVVVRAFPPDGCARAWGATARPSGAPQALRVGRLRAVRRPGWRRGVLRAGGVVAIGRGDYLNSPSCAQ